MRFGVLALAVVSSLGMAQAAQAAGSDRFSIGVQPSYFEGKYGTGSKVKITYVPVFLKYKTGDASFKATIPYISVKSSGALVSGGTVIGGSTSSGRRSGLGDIWLEGKYKLRTADGIVPNFIPYTKVKLPTASKHKSLGTGRLDAEFGSAVEWAIDKTLFPFAKVGYRIVGKPSSLNLRNVVTYQGGVTYGVEDANYLTLMYSGHQAIQRGFTATSDLIAAWDWKVDNSIGVQLYGDKGLSDGSPDFGVGLGVNVAF